MDPNSQTESNSWGVLLSCFLWKKLKNLNRNVRICLSKKERKVRLISKKIFKSFYLYRYRKDIKVDELDY